MFDSPEQVKVLAGPDNPRKNECVARHKGRFKFQDTEITRTFERWIEQDDDMVAEPSIQVRGDAIYPTRLNVGSALIPRFPLHMARFRELLAEVERQEGVKFDMGRLDEWMRLPMAYHTMGFGVAYRDTPRTRRLKVWFILDIARCDWTAILEHIYATCGIGWSEFTNQCMLRGKLIGMEWDADGRCGPKLYARFKGVPSIPAVAERYNEHEKALLERASKWFVYVQGTGDPHSLNLPTPVLRQELGVPPRIPLEERPEGHPIAMLKDEMRAPGLLRHYNLYY